MSQPVADGGRRVRARDARRPKWLVAAVVVGVAATVVVLGKALLSARGRTLHLAGTLSLDHWRGRPRVQLRIIDAAEPATTR